MAPLQQQQQQQQARRLSISGGSLQRVSSRNTQIFVAVWIVIILISVVGPSYFLTERAGQFLYGPVNLLLDDSPDEFQVEEELRRMEEHTLHLRSRPAPSMLAHCNDSSLLEHSTCEDVDSCGDEVGGAHIALEDPARGSEQGGWQREVRPAKSTHNVRILRDQLVVARAFLSMNALPNSSRLFKDLKYRTKENLKVIEDITVDAELPRGAEEKMKAMSRLLTRVGLLRSDDKALVKRLKIMLVAAENQLRIQKKQSNYLSQLAAKTVPKGLHCLSMRLTVSYDALPIAEREIPETPKLTDNFLFHYAIFSDNVLAVSVVVNSTITNAKEPEKHVFHIVTDTLNYGAMVMWFRGNLPGNATIQVQNVDTFKWLNASYCPVLEQLESESMKEYFFKVEKERVSANLKYRNPKYLSMLNHLRFYLPEVFPKLDKVLFLDDDIVVMKDLTPLWRENLHGNVNGAVETCGKTFHRFDRYLNFSNPHIYKNFSPRDCGWAYGMNIFDLKAWKLHDITGIYHKWQTLNADRSLWKLGTLPPGLITFHKLTHSLAKSWHVLGLGYNADTSSKAIEIAAVVHYNGNLKPWLDIGISKFKPYWAKYVKYDHPWLQQCNLVSD